MSSRSISSAKISGLHLKQRPRWSSPSVTKILPAILKQSSSPHCSFSVALGNDRQYERMESTFMSGPPQGSFHHRDTEERAISNQHSANQDWVRRSELAECQ